MTNIDVGDEVRFAETSTTFIVFFKDGDLISGLNGRGDMFCDKLSSKWVKTGRHFPEVKELLSIIKAEEAKA